MGRVLRSHTLVIRSKTLLAVLGLCASDCVHGVLPEDAMRSYARALEEGRLDDAWALSAALDQAQFAERYAEPARRHQRAEEVLRAAEGQASTGLAIEARAGAYRVIEAPAAVATKDDALQAAALVEHFLASAQRGDFDAVFADLAASWRARYSPQRLKADFEAEPAAAARLERIRAALPGKWELTAAGPELPLGEGKRLKVLREGDGLKVAALE